MFYRIVDGSPINSDSVEAPFHFSGRQNDRNAYERSYSRQEARERGRNMTFPLGTMFTKMEPHPTRPQLFVLPYQEPGLQVTNP